MTTDPADPTGGGVLIEQFERLAARARHPALTDLGEVRDYEDREQPTEVELRTERWLRGAVLLAANTIVDECVADLVELQSGGMSFGVDDAVRPDQADGTFVWRFFPPRFRRAYSYDFFVNVMVSAVKVAYDLANPNGEQPACIAEELIINAICQYTYSLMDEAGLECSDSLEDRLLDDLDFEMLFDKHMDGFEDDPALQRSMGMWVPSVANWFVPFNPDRIVHPYAETESTSPRAHDLHHLLVTDELHEQCQDPTVIDDPAPIAGLQPISEAVALARAASEPEPLTWVPDSADPEASYEALLALAATARSGWMTWEPHEGADRVRTDAAVHFKPHRHYPVGPDQPWAEAAVTGGTVLHVPLAAIVSYRPDPTVR